MMKPSLNLLNIAYLDTALASIPIVVSLGGIEECPPAVVTLNSKATYPFSATPILHKIYNKIIEVNNENCSLMCKIIVIFMADSEDLVDLCSWSTVSKN